MPSVYTLNLVIRNLDAFRAACRRRGWEFRAGQRRYRWFGRWLDDQPLPGGLTPVELGRCAHAVGIPGCLYEVGLIWRGDHFRPVWDDEPAGGLNVALGPGGGVLWQAYVSEAARRAAHVRGHLVSRTSGRSGVLRLRIVDRVTGHAAQLRVLPDGATTLWDFADVPTFRYLADALATAPSVVLSLSYCDTADQ
jgi:hypothetical protein